ncbi:MAG: T9SS type A sorting domain-containing protein [Bacteroidetes bacterium]|nr:MAG: T9SS type A sorting domain-containing protein [Bacteroidota bacterium]
MILKTIQSFVIPYGSLTDDSVIKYKKESEESQHLENSMYIGSSCFASMANLFIGYRQLNNTGTMINKKRTPLAALLHVIVATLLCALSLQGTTVYVAVNGNDTVNDGSFTLPYKTITKAVSVIVAGDTMYVRGGTHTYSSTITLNKIGTDSTRIYLLAYDGERALLDFSSMPVSSSNRGIRVSGDYWYIRGFDVWKAGDNGMHISGSNNIIEFCTFSENYDTGLQLGGGASNNRIINCDSYYNADPDHGDADGFAPKLDVGTGNYFYGCRAWQNSDDGWDGYLRSADNVTTTLEYCWVFNNGYLKDGSESFGNGNGFKLGGGDNGNADSLRHNMILKNCLAFDNRVKGYDQNNNRGSMTLLNCTAYRNGTNYRINGTIRSTSTVTVKNCVSLGAYGSLGSYTVQATNSWMSPFVVTNDDFVSIDTAGVRGPRNPDGSLPALPFMNLAGGSDLIDSGTDVGLPYVGVAPDLGAFEYTPPDVVPEDEQSPVRFALFQNYPNPFNPVTVIGYSLSAQSYVTLKVYDILGKEVSTIVDEVQASGFKSYTWDASGFPSGVYYCRISVVGQVGQDGILSYNGIKKMLLMK